MTHLDELTIHAIADGEAADAHVRECAQCAAAVLDVMRLKRAIRALPRAAAPRVRRRNVWIPLAAVARATWST